MVEGDGALRPSPQFTLLPSLDELLEAPSPPFPAEFLFDLPKELLRPERTARIGTPPQQMRRGHVILRRVLLPPGFSAAGRGPELHIEHSVNYEACNRVVATRRQLSQVRGSAPSPSIEDRGAHVRLSLSALSRPSPKRANYSCTAPRSM